MPVDPSISLAVAPTPGSPAATGQGSSPLGMISGLADVATKFQQLHQLQLSMQARQRAGEIIAGAPDMETGITSAFQDPLVAAYGGEALNQIRQGMLAQTQQQVAVGGMQRSGVHDLIGALAGSAGDQSAADPLAQSIIQATPPQARAAVSSAYDNIKGYLAQYPDPAVRKQKLMALELGSGGVSPEAYRQSTGQPPAGFVQTPGGASIPAGGGGENGMTSLSGAGGGQAASPAGPGAGGNALGVPNAPVVPSGATFDGQTQAAPAAPAAGSALAGDNRPLIPSGFRMTSPTLGTGVGGVPVMSETQASQAHQLGQDYSTTGLKDLNSAQTGLASLRYMDNAYDQMVKGGGFLIPGAAAQGRAGLARLVNTVAQITGVTPPFDPSKVASIEDFNKETKRMGAQVTNSFFGGNHDAAQTINSMTSSVPGVDNTYLGGKLVSEGIRASMQRVVDMRNFQSTWMNQNKGNLTGAQEAFNQLHPAEDYANSALAKFGMTANGFSSPAAIKQAYSEGYLTLEQAKQLAQQQFPAGPGGQTNAKP